MESNLFPPKVTKALQAADRRDARESGGTCPSDCLVSSATQVKHLALTLLLFPFPWWTAVGQHAILEPYNWMLEIKRCWPGNGLYSACKGKPQVSTLQQDEESAPALQRGTFPVATTTAAASEWPPTALPRLPCEEMPSSNSKKSCPMLCSRKTWRARHQRHGVTLLPQPEARLLVSRQHATSSHISGCFSLTCHCGATLTEGRGEADSPGATCMRYMYSQWTTYKIRGIFVRSIRVLKMRSLIHRFATPMLGQDNLLGSSPRPHGRNSTAMAQFHRSQN